MNVKERYDNLIIKIEDMSQKKYKRSTKIMNEIISESMLPSKEIDSIFKFMTSQTLLEYIRERKLNSAYESIISSEKFDIESAIELTDYDNQSSFTKKFSAFYGMSPKEAFIYKDISLITEPMTWNYISSNNIKRGGNNNLMKKEFKFGIKKERCDKIIEASELKLLYGFEDVYSNLAFEISEEYNLPLKETFKYIDILKDYRENRKIFIEGLEPDIKDLAYDSYKRIMFFERHILPSDAMRIMIKTGLSAQEIFDMDCELISAYALVEDIDFEYFKKAYSYYKANSDDCYSEENFEYYLDNISSGKHYIEAFNLLIPYDLDDYTYDESDDYEDAEDYYYIEEQFDRESKEIDYVDELEEKFGTEDNCFYEDDYIEEAYDYDEDYYRKMNYKESEDIFDEDAYYDGRDLDDF